MVEGATLVTVLRHGAVAGAPFVYRGRQDDPLSETGWRQMEAAVGADAYDVIASSPLLRCREFAQELALRTGVSLQILPAFQEIDFGAWEGLTPEQAAARHPEQHRLFRAGSGAAPDGESLTDLHHRVSLGWENWLTDSGGGRRLLVTHAGVMRALLLDLLDLPATSIHRIALPEAACFQVSILAGEAPVLLNLNPAAMGV